MGAYTNVNVEARRDVAVEKRLEKIKLEAELKFYRERCDWLTSVFENIPDAIEKYGYVDLKVGINTVKLVKATE